MTFKYNKCQVLHMSCDKDYHLVAIKQAVKMLEMVRFNVKVKNCTKLKC
jgi:hypothetical protein